MDMHSRDQYLEQLQGEYLANRSKQARGTLLDEAVKRTGLNRKYLMVKLSPAYRWKKLPRKRRLASVIYPTNLTLLLVRIWEIFGTPCGQRLEPLLKTELPRLRSLGELILSDDQFRLLSQMSARTIDRRLAHEKEVRLIRRQSQPKHPLLYQLIPTKMSDEFDRIRPGQIQTDGVEHCGASSHGDYINSIPTLDVASYWWEATAVMGKGQRATEQALERNRRRMPFTWTELHPDNGTSFLNWHLWGYAQRTDLALSRSRAYQKNDNCFIEQSHSTNVRAYVGHVRYDTERELELLNKLYDVLRLYKNFFQPVMRLEIKIRDKGHISRRYQPAKTPYQWLMEHTEIPNQTKQMLMIQYEQLNPAHLKRQIDHILDQLAHVYQTKHARSSVTNNQPVRLDFPLAEQPAVRLGATMA